VLFALNQTLLQHESVRAGSLQGSYTTEDLITHYNCGDLSSIIFNHDTSQVHPPLLEDGKALKPCYSILVLKMQAFVSTQH
jgi:hypothetical protein